MSELAAMILRMTASSALYVLVTAVLWRAFGDRRHSMKIRILVGVIFGLCSVASTHLGTNYIEMVLNVRDLGPLAAGLFFDPVSGVIAGLIGGIERLIAGTYFGIGSFTRIACSVSTCLAGFLSSLLYLLLFKGKRAPVVHAFIIGAVMEDFHMYAILITHRERLQQAYFVVRTIAFPMIIFSGLGLAACSLVIMGLSGELHWDKFFYSMKNEQTPIARRFQRWLLLVTLLVFMINYCISNQIQGRIGYQSARASLNSLVTYYYMFFDDLTDDPDMAERLMGYIAFDSDAYYVLFDSDRNILSSSRMFEEGTDDRKLTEEEYALFREHLDKDVYEASPDYFEGQEMLCRTKTLGNGKMLTVWHGFDSFYQQRDYEMYETTLSDILVFSFLYLIITILVKYLVVGNLKAVNRSLGKIINGDLNETVSVRGSSEFVSLSEDINRTVTALKGYIDASEKRMEQELHLAATIQESSLPRTFEFPRDDFEIYALMEPARFVGGDFYDYFFIDSDKLVLVIADVSGKGIPAALFMMRCKTAIENLARVGNSPEILLQEVNRILCEGNDAEMFVTAWIGILDLTSGTMQCANAGHEYPLLMRDGGSYTLIRDSHSLVLGALEEVQIKEYELHLNPGDRLFVYTDGVPEAVNEKNEQYGTDRLVSKLNVMRHASEQELLHAVREDIREFVGSAEQFDDITMIGFTYKGE